MGNIIEIHNLTKSYGKARGVTGLSLNVREGDIFGFIGPNGAGKSTTIRTLLGLLTPTKGYAKLFGLDCRKDKVKILEEVGYMPSEAMFYNNMRVEEIIALSAKLRKKDCRAEAGKLCQRLQLDGKKKIEELSLGNRKKVSIVCAMQHKPKLYIFDEPTSGLDPLMQKEYFTLLKERHQEGATIFLSSHVLSEIRRYCNNAAIIRDGRLVVSDSVTALTRTSARRVNIHGITALPAISGAVDVSVNGDMVSFLYGGEMDALITALNGLSITDLTITEPDLEEVFMHFYSNGGDR